MNNAKAIDVHNHFYPPAYLEELIKGKYVAKLTEDNNNNYILAYEGDYNIIVPGHRDIKYRLELLDKVGMETQILSLTTPGVHIEERDKGIYLAKISNDDFARISAEYPGRFYGLAALPLQDPEESAKELERAVKELGLVGGTIFTNVEGKNLDDPSFLCLYETAKELDVPLFIHPTTPTPSDNFIDYRLVASLGFTFDTTLVVSRLIFSGILDKVPCLKLIAAHLGGCLPYLSERLDRCHKAFPELKNIQKKPSDYIKDVYIDCVSFEPKAVEFALSYMGDKRLLVGSDYPHQIGNIEKAVEIVNTINATDEQRELILHKNAEELFKL
jgi:aminocarboxymuconate-semialdehyde decarboxylase